MLVLAEEFPYYKPSQWDYECGLYLPSQCSDGRIAYAVALNWKSNGSGYLPCYPTLNCAVAFSEVYVSAQWAAQCSNRTTDAWTYIWAHEFGHTMGLEDHDSGSMLMNNGFTGCVPNTSARAPQSADLGTPIPSGATNCGSPRGIRCIFRWPT